MDGVSEDAAFQSIAIDATLRRGGDGEQQHERKKPMQPEHEISLQVTAFGLTRSAELALDRGAPRGLRDISRTAG